MAGQTILIVEDEKDIAEVVAYNLKREGFRTVTAGSGEKGLALAASTLPSLILLDLMLPGMDGREVCRRLKASEATRSIPIVILTARSEDSDVVAGLELGAEDYITKPFSPRVLMARVRAVLRRRQPSVCAWVSWTSIRRAGWCAAPLLRWSSRPPSSTCWCFWRGIPAGSSPGSRSSPGCAEATTR